MPKIFISHSWEDNEIARKLAEYLRRDGAEVWIDTSRICGGDSLPDAIGEGIEWCDSMVLMWSKSAKYSRYVTLERNCALNLNKRIIPCVIDKEKLPTIISHFLHIDFKNVEQGYSNLAKSINLTKQDQKLYKKTPLTSEIYKIKNIPFIGIFLINLIHSLLSKRKIRVDTRKKILKNQKVEKEQSGKESFIKKPTFEQIKEYDPKIRVIKYKSYASRLAIFLLILFFIFMIVKIQFGNKIIELWQNAITAIRGVH